MCSVLDEEIIFPYSFFDVDESYTPDEFDSDMYLDEEGY